MKRLLVFCLLLLTSAVTSDHVLSADEFKTEFDVTYDSKQNGETQVTQDITITNLKDDVIATNYSLTLKQMLIYDLQATDQIGQMEIINEQDNDTTSIKVLFNENIIGKDRSNNFTLKYKTKDIATKIGEIYTVRVPKIADLDIIREYKVRLIIPNSFGPNIFITPEPKLLKKEDNRTEYTFTKEVLENKGISASFGEYQVLNYKLTYQLENKSFLANIQEIALPPDIEHLQQIRYKKISPEPYKVHQDSDGNLLAQYSLKPRSKLEVELTGSVRLMGRQINPELGGQFSEIPKELIEKYLGAEKYWEVDDPMIQNLKSKIFDKELNVSQNAQLIYTFVVNSLDYDFDVIQKDYLERSGALKALNKEAPAACMEFTDLFITMARSAGIPARELNGYAINVYQNVNLPLSIKLKSGDFLHSWPEYYDPNFGWVPVDPTWGNTSQLDFFSKLDNSHFAFVIKGLTSEYPLPAGFYRSDDSKKLVEVDISENGDEADFGHFVSLYKRFTLNPLYLVTGYRKYYAKNEGGTYIYKLEGETLLPFQVKTLSLPKKRDVLRFEDLNGELHTQNIIFTDKNPRRYLINPWAAIFSLFLGLGLCGFAYYFLVVRGYRQKLLHHLRTRLQDLNPRRNRS